MTRSAVRGLGMGLALMLASGCGATPLPSGSPTPRASATGAVSSRPAQSAPPLDDPGQRPGIWFGPLDPWSWDRFDPGSGPHAFADLFPADAPWPQVAHAVNVFGLNSNWLEFFGSDAEIRQAINGLQARGIALWTEAGQLTETAACNASTLEGFSGAPPARRAAERVRDLGGVLATFKLEHGFDAATYYDAACRMTPQEIADDTVHTVEAVRSVFPNVVIGSVETANLDPDAVASWLDAYRAALGEDLGYFHLDVNFTIPDWAARAKQIQDVVHARGVEFGIIYTGDEGDTTDAAWLARAEERAVEYEVVAGGRPDQVVFQSWQRHPETLLPETQAGTFTNLIARYLRPRTTLSVQLDGGSATGRLTAADGTGVADAVVELSAHPTGGAGVPGTYLIKGVVPEGATQADVGLRVNTECDCSGPAELALDGVSYVQANDSGDRVPNGTFSAGFDGWGAWGSGAYDLVGAGAAAAVHITAAAGQDVGLNSGSFAVSAGATFTVTFKATVAPASAGHGYFDVVFLAGDTEVTRFKVDLAAADLSLGQVQTDAEGRFQVDLASLPAGSLEVHAWYPGDDSRWPSIATATQEVRR